MAAHFRPDGKERKRESALPGYCVEPGVRSCTWADAQRQPSMKLMLVHPLAGPSGGSHCPERGAVYEREASEKKSKAASCP